ncbi:MAG: hypothetical protein J5527_09370 [Treponema sp.]|nr:hypothetical protein [Treponema sp.]
MNLILNVNTGLHSVQGSAEGELKVHAAIADAIDEIKEQTKINGKRIKDGLKPFPYKAVIKDEYGKDFVVIKETRSLEEIRQEYRKKQDGYSYETRENNLLLAMNEVGNSSKDEFTFKKDLNKTLNSALFVTDAELSPGLERILDYFGDPKGLFNAINFKQEISAKCIKDLIDMPNPKTGKPPKSFEHLMSNIMSINRIFRENTDKDKYIEIARNYINIRYRKYIPEKYKSFFETRGGLSPLIVEIENLNSKKKKINELEFEVSEKNFKKLYQSFCDLPQFKNNPSELASYLFQRVPKENKENFTKWLVSIGCKDAVSTYRIFAKWSNEKKEGKNQENKDLDTKGLRGE